jgi:phosphoglycerate dehydrogenase-like enzyme
MGAKSAGQVVVVAPASMDYLISPVEEELARLGHEVLRYYPERDGLPEDGGWLRDAGVLLIARAECTRQMLAGARCLRAVVSPYTGTDGIDEDAASELGILVANGQTQENVQSMAEAVIMLMLVCLYTLRASETVLRENLPRPPVQARMLRGKLIGLIGCGQIARAVIERLDGWGARIQTFSRYLHTPLPPGVTAVDLETLLRTSDIVSVHTPLTSETRDLLGAKRLALLKPGVIFINTARGGIADELALYRMALDGRIGQLALDVFDTELPAPDSPLLELPNAVLTPHMIGHTQETMETLRQTAVENIVRIFAGQTPVYTRNPQILQGWLKRWGAQRED